MEVQLPQVQVLFDLREEMVEPALAMAVQVEVVLQEVVAMVAMEVTQLLMQEVQEVQLVPPVRELPVLLEEQVAIVIVVE